MTASDLYQCVVMAQQDGWNGGVMFWEWTGVGHLLYLIRATDALVGRSSRHGNG